jgi:putative glycosyltransferase
LEAPKKLSVVTTLYRSEATVEEFHRRVAAVASRAAAEIEFIYVNDGSPDCSMDKILDLRRADPRITVVELARNFGHHPALMTALALSSGDLVFLIDSDLEEPPELLEEFAAQLGKRSDADAVYGVQPQRKGGRRERLAGRLWYAFFCRLADVPYPADSLTARLMTRRFVNSVLLHQERDLDMMGIFALAGYQQIALPSTKTSKGNSSYTFMSRLNIAATGLTAFTSAPLTLIVAVGCLMTLCSILAGVIWIAASWRGAVSFGAANFAAWSIWFVGGLLLTAIGVVALYAKAILQETKGRPRTIIKHIYAAEAS